MQLNRARSYLQGASATALVLRLARGLPAPHRLLVAVQDGQIAGYASSSSFRPKPAYDSSIEVTVYLRPSGSLDWVDEEALRAPAERRTLSREELARENRASDARKF